MKLADLHKTTIEYGKAADPRTKAQLTKILGKVAKQQKKLEGTAKKFADSTLTWNPYHDSRILNGTGKEEVKHLAVGIDIETSELLLLDRLREQGQKIDAVFAHHPKGRSLAELDKVMPLEVDLLHELGVPLNVGESSLTPHQGKIYRSIHAKNLFREQRAAELLNIPMFNCHTPTDNLAWQFVRKLLTKEFDSLQEIVDVLHKIPEYIAFGELGNPCIIAHGSPNARPGTIAVSEFTGGTNGPEEFVAAQAKAGVGTIISMHATEASIKKAKEHNMYYVQCSHMASDSLGVNLMLDKLLKDEPKLQIVELSGFVRVKR